MDDIVRGNDRFPSNLLFDFNALVDLDIGMIKYIKLNFLNSKFIDKDILINDDIKFYEALLIDRQIKNPLHLVVKPNYIDQIDNLYNEIYEKHQIKILLLSPFLAFAKILIHTSKLDFVHNTVLCKNEREEQYIKKVFPNVLTILRTTKDLDIDIYDAAYIKDIDDLSLFQDMAKDVYVYNYAFNMEHGLQGLPKLEAYGKMLTSLKLHIAAPYSDYKKPI